MDKLLLTPPGSDSTSPPTQDLQNFNINSATNLPYLPAVYEALSSVLYGGISLPSPLLTQFLQHNINMENVQQCERVRSLSRGMGLNDKNQLSAAPRPNNIQSIETVSVSSTSQSVESARSTPEDKVRLRDQPWSYQEQFKPLYEMGNETNRKDFLDELFRFLHFKGSPMNRVPIMAKKTLDIYKLFHLVVERGGVVEVINRKSWKDITKGLDLPNSITSAAFTLRSQYVRFLYEFEKMKHNFSTDEELKIAIDGNKREGKREEFSYPPIFDYKKWTSFPFQPQMPQFGLFPQPPPSLVCPTHLLHVVGRTKREPHVSAETCPGAPSKRLRLEEEDQKPLSPPPKSLFMNKPETQTVVFQNLTGSRIVGEDGEEKVFISTVHDGKIYEGFLHPRPPSTQEINNNVTK